MNKISAAGRIVADAELRHTPNGDPVCQFRLASDVGYGDRKTTNWFNCQIWGRRAEGIVQHLVKGTPVTVWGTLTMREWTNKEGIKQLSPDIRIDELALHGGRDSEGGRREAPQREAPERQQRQTPANLSEMDSDIPF